VFSETPAWIKQESPKTKELWAPDISYIDGKFHLYYAYSSFGVNTSGIALLTNKTLNQQSPDFHWVDEGPVLKSRAEDDFNAIDPNLILDEKGRAWLSFGSFWSGIKMRKLDRKTGKLSSDDTKVYSLASRYRPEHYDPAKPGLPPDYQAIEAPFIVRHGDYYYLFVSYDLCCRGTKSTYHTLVGRSKEVTGPYLDAAGKNMSEGGATPEERLTLAFRLVTARQPRPGELKILVDGFRDHLTRYRKDPEASLLLVRAGEAPIEPKLGTEELAAYSAMAGLILNLDETVTRE